MTHAELKAARLALGIKAAELGRRLELEGDDPGRSVRLWEAGRKVPGPVAVAVRYMLKELEAQSFPNAPVAFSDPPEPVRAIKTRRRGQ